MAGTIGFIGVGNMGYHMAANVRKKMASASIFYVFNVNQDACQRFLKEYSSFGPIHVSSSCKELAATSSTIISMVPMDQHARAVYLDTEKGVIAAGPDPNRLVLECSTISVSTSRAIGREIMAADVATFVDTPVSGGVWGAEAGSLSFFCGHAAAAATDSEGNTIATRIQETVGFMGSPERINFCGTLGSGLVTKIVNNYIGLTNIAVTAQGFAFGLRHGVDRKTLAKSISGSAGDSWVLHNSPPVPGLKPQSPSSNGFKPGFSARLCAKDISLAIEAAGQVGIDASLGQVAVKMFQEAEDDPRTTGLDCTSIWLHINDEVDNFVKVQSQQES